MSSYEHPLSEFLSANANLLSEGRVEGKLYRISWYPGLVCEPNSNNWVYGEVYQFNSPDIFQQLDDYEGPEYDRKIVDCTIEGEEVLVWTYQYHGSINHSALIESGRFS